MKTTLLSVETLSAGYGGRPIVQDAELTVSEQEIVCLIGPNGAGKSTLLKAVAGSLTPAAGVVRFQGVDVTRSNPAEKGRRGLIFIPQGETVFPNLTVRENLEMSVFVLPDRSFLLRRMGTVFEYFPWIREQSARSAGALSGGQRQMLSLSRILLTRPRLALLDEPSLGLSPRLVDEIYETITNLRNTGVSFLIVEQNARKGLSVARRGIVMEQGRIRLTGSGRELMDNPDVQRLYLGG